MANTAPKVGVPKVSALADLLERHSPTSLQTWREAYPDVALRVLGVPDEAQMAYADLALRGLQETSKLAPRALSLLRSRLDRAKVLRLVGALIAAVTGGEILRLALSSPVPKGVLPIVVAGLNPAGTACVFIAGYLDGPLYSAKGSTGDIFEGLVSASAEADQLARMLTADVQVGAWTPEVAERVQRANALAADLLKWERRLGIA